MSDVATKAVKDDLQVGHIDGSLFIALHSVNTELWLCTVVYCLFHGLKVMEFASLFLIM